MMTEYQMNVVAFGLVIIFAVSIVLFTLSKILDGVLGFLIMSRDRKLRNAIVQLYVAKSIHLVTGSTSYLSLALDFYQDMLDNYYGAITPRRVDLYSIRFPSDMKTFMSEYLTLIGYTHLNCPSFRGRFKPNKFAIVGIEHADVKNTMDQTREAKQIRKFFRAYGVDKLC